MLAFPLGSIVLVGATLLAVGHVVPPTPAGPATSRDAELPAVVSNDNRRPAGITADGVVALELRVAVGLWRPDGDAGKALRIEAFGEGVSPLSVPAPLIRVTEGTELAVNLHNTLTWPMRVHGLCERGGPVCAPIDVPAGQRRLWRFRSGPAGTYHYWATTTGAPQQFRAADDTQLSGAFVVDPPGAAADADRVLVITEWTSLTREQLRDLVAQDDPGATFLKLRPEVRFAINGRAWPHTERLTYTLGEHVNWRVINLSTQVHPMHLHGFYFDVTSLGDGVRDRALAQGQQPRVVTQVMSPGSTLGMTWIPERVGNWLFHCHVMLHVSPLLHVDGSPRLDQGHDEGHHLSAGMTGMVLGVTVRAPANTPPPQDDEPRQAPRRLTLLMKSEPGRFGDHPAFGFLFAEDPSRSGRLPVPGPTLVLTRGEPVELTLVNRLPEATAIHWHGMELDSYYDGVHGWGGTDRRVTPMIEPDDSFIVRFTPPRAGTFMYHTHLHDNRQLTSGLYGAMLVVEPGETHDERTDHVFVIGRGGPQIDAPAVINGQSSLQVSWAAGTRHRVRLINITPNDIFSVSLQTKDGPVTWRPLTKDGAPVPSNRGIPAPAAQVIAVGETYDFEYQTPRGRQNLWLEVRSPAGKWHVQGHVIVK